MKAYEAMQRPTMDFKEEEQTLSNVSFIVS